MCLIIQGGQQITLCSVPGFGTNWETDVWVGEKVRRHADCWWRCLEDAAWSSAGLLLLSPLTELPRPWQSKQLWLYPCSEWDRRAPSAGRTEEKSRAYHACSVPALRLTIQRAGEAGRQEVRTAERRVLREGRKPGKDIPSAGIEK